MQESPYKKAMIELDIVKTIEKAITELERKHDEDKDYIHLNIHMLAQTIEVLSNLKGTLEKQANEQVE